MTSFTQYAASYKEGFPKEVRADSTTTNHIGTDVPIRPAGQSPAIFICRQEPVELRSTGQMRTSVPTRFVVMLSRPLLYNRVL